MFKSRPSWGLGKNVSKTDWQTAAVMRYPVHVLGSSHFSLRIRLSFSKEVPQSAPNYALRTLGVARLERFYTCHHEAVPRICPGCRFGAVMLAIGLGAIWVVRWQTFYILRNQAEPEGSCCGCLNLLP
jgi:hypothetical protein